MRVVPATTGPGGLRSTSSRSSRSVEKCIGDLACADVGSSGIVVACDPSLEGVLAAVGATYLAHLDPALVRLGRADACQPMIGELAVEGPDAMGDGTAELAERVWRGLEAAISTGCSRARGGACSGSCHATCVWRVALAAASDSPTMPEAVHRYVRLAFDVRGGIRAMPTDDRTLALDRLAARVSSECEAARQFVRFSRMSDGTYASVFVPNENVVPLVGDHFARRMRDERFCIVDPQHLVGTFHEAGARHCQPMRLDRTLARQLAGRTDLASDERYVRALWKRLYDGLALPGRGREDRGYDLRASFMPKRFWGGLTELDPRSDDPGAFVPARYAGGTGGRGPQALLAD